MTSRLCERALPSTNKAYQAVQFMEGRNDIELLAARENCVDLVLGVAHRFGPLGRHRDGAVSGCSKIVSRREHRFGVSGWQSLTDREEVAPHGIAVAQIVVCIACLPLVQDSLGRHRLDAGGWPGSSTSVYQRLSLDRCTWYFKLTPNARYHASGVSDMRSVEPDAVHDHETQHNQAPSQAPM